MRMVMVRYYILRPGGERITADPRDFDGIPPDYRFIGTLMRAEHPYVTNTGRIVYAPRKLKANPTMRDLQRLAVPF
jgi:hypothetical protein